MPTQIQMDQLQQKYTLDYAGYLVTKAKPDSPITSDAVRMNGVAYPVWAVERYLADGVWPAGRDSSKRRPYTSRDRDTSGVVEAKDKYANI